MPNKQNLAKNVDLEQMLQNQFVLRQLMAVCGICINLINGRYADSVDPVETTQKAA